MSLLGSNRNDTQSRLELTISSRIEKATLRHSELARYTAMLP